LEKVRITLIRETKVEKKGNISHRKRSPKGEKYVRKALKEKEG
jgi:hypothetical protein